MKHITPEKLLTILIIFLVGYILYYIYFPFDILKIVQPFKTISNEQIIRGGEEYNVFYTGEALTFYVEYKKNFDIPGINNRYLWCEDGNLVTMTPLDSHLLDGDYTGENRLISSYNILPQKTSTDMLCKLVFESEYYVHKVLRTVHETYETEWFYVKTREVPAN